MTTKKIPREPTTIEELRDWHAYANGWEFNTARFSAWCRTDYGARPKEDHPIEDTIDAAVRAFPEGWIWARDFRCYAFKPEGDGPRLDVVGFDITGHTPEAIRRDILALARLAKIAEGAAP